MIRRSLRVLATGLAMLVVAGVTASAASELGLVSSGGGQISVRASRCTSQAVTLNLAAASIAVTGIDTACNGKKLQVSVRNGQTTWRVSGTVSGTTLTLTPTGAVDSVQSVAVTIGSWLIGSTWSVKPVDLPMISCKAVDNPSARCWTEYRKFSSWPTPPTTYQIYVDVVTDSTTPITWQLTYNLSHADWPFFAKSLKNNQPGGLVLISTSGCSATPRTVTVQGYPGWGKDKISAGKKSDVDMMGLTTAGGDLLSC